VGGVTAALSAPCAGSSSPRPASLPEQRAKHLHDPPQLPPRLRQVMSLQGLDQHVVLRDGPPGLRKGHPFLSPYYCEPLPARAGPG
jgi:hypothetical protein